MTPRNIRQTDLNLLIALNVLMEERNVTRAADRLDLTQSAASRMLGRLRATFDDPLLVRTSRGLTPTKRALDLAGPLKEYLDGAAAISYCGYRLRAGGSARAARCEIAASSAAN
jgi:DNA-binding transcriptional LysR family regulator